MSSFFEDFDPLLHFSNKITGFYESFASSMVTASCEAHGSEDCRDDQAALQLKMIAISTILISGIIGVSLPFLLRKRRSFESEGSGSGLLSVLKAFAAGVILATGFVHMLHDANEALSAPCLPARPWRHFPFSGFIAMLAALVTLLVDFLITSVYEHKHKEKTLLRKSNCGDLAAAVAAEVIPFDANERGISVNSVGSQRGGYVEDDRMHIIGIRAHVGSLYASTSRAPEANDAASIYESIHSQARHAVVSQILELGIVSHSVIIGLSLGVSRSPCTIRPLVAALSFHQFFEGFALGGCITQAQFKNFSAFMMASFFAITTPIGVGIGAGISTFYDSNSPGALVVEGILDSISAGILIYMSLVDLIAADFQSRTMRSNGRLLFASYLALFMGAGMMSTLAIWE